MWALLGAVPSGWTLNISCGALSQFDEITYQLVFSPNIGVDQKSVGNGAPVEAEGNCVCVTLTVSVALQAKKVSLT
jgi:hypothetical protein